MKAQCTAALVVENRVLCHPASVDSVPTSGRHKDHVSMGWGAGRKLGAVLGNVTRVMADYQFRTDTAVAQDFVFTYFTP